MQSTTNASSIHLAMGERVRFIIRLVHANGLYATATERAKDKKVFLTFFFLKKDDLTDMNRKQPKGRKPPPARLERSTHRLRLIFFLQNFKNGSLSWTRFITSFSYLLAVGQRRCIQR